MAKLGEILTAAGHLNQDGLEEALDWQVLYGNRLGTNLLELHLVTEEQLAIALSRQLGVEVVWGELEIDPSLVGILPPHVADRGEIIPWRVEKRRLKVLCCEPKPSEIDQLSYKLGRPCVPVIAPEFRIFQLLRKHYKATRPLRALDFGIVPEEGREERRKKKAKDQGKAPPPPAPELIDEGAFNDIYNQVIAGGSARSGPAPSWQPATPPSSPPVLAPSAPPAPTPVAAAPPAPTTRRTAPPAPRAAAPAPPPPQVVPPSVDQLVETVLEALPEGAILGDAGAGAEPPELPLQPVQWDEVPAPPPPARDESPLAFRDALRLLEGVTDRDNIAHIVLRASRNKAARALLLQVQGGVALGWDGLGEGLEGGAARSVAIPLGADSAFSLVARTRSHYMGSLQKTPTNIRFLAATGKKVPLSSLILPILHRGRVSYLLYLDNGHRQQAPTDVGEMLILSQRIGQSVDALVERKRRESARG